MFILLSNSLKQYNNNNISTNAPKEYSNIPFKNNDIIKIRLVIKKDIKKIEIKSLLYRKPYLILTTIFITIKYKKYETKKDIPKPFNPQNL